VAIAFVVPKRGEGGERDNKRSPCTTTYILHPLAGEKRGGGVTSVRPRAAPYIGIEGGEGKEKKPSLYRRAVSARIAEETFRPEPASLIP